MIKRLKYFYITLVLIMSNIVASAINIELVNEPVEGNLLKALMIWWTHLSSVLTIFMVFITFTSFEEERNNDER